MIEGVKVKQLRVRCDERGRLAEILRRDEEFFEEFGQVYMTTAYPGVVKAWHYHERQTDHFAAIGGMVKIVLYDARDASPSRGEISEFFAGEHNPILIKIPRLVYHGFKCIGEHEAILINIPTNVYDHGHPDEHRIDPHDPSIPYDWERKDG